MPILSPFQILPTHIAEAIAYYCIGLQRHRHKHRQEENEAERVWLVLQDVSYSWMQLARRTLNKSVYLQLPKDPEGNDESVTRFQPVRVIEQSMAITREVKVVHIEFYDNVVNPDEEDIEELDQVWPENLVFQKARTLHCYLVFEYTELPDRARDDRYFKWFVERARLSFPNLQEFKISFGLRGEMSVSPGVFFSKDWDASLFLAAIFRAARWHANEVLNPAHMETEHILMNHAPEITRLCYALRFKHKFFSWIAKKSAKTLELLDNATGDSGGLKEFMFDDDDKVVVYPRLRYLYVRDRSDDKGGLTTDKSIVPFPALQRLKMYSRCIFKDDTLFRGLNGTLISLDIGLHREFVDIFRKHKVFSQGAYRNVLHISATLDNEHGSTLPADEFAVAAFELISPTTQSMTIIGEISFQHISSVIPTCPYLENIQILKLFRIGLSLLEILDVFKHFPRMTDFGCQLRGIDPELAAIQHELIPSHLGSQYSQLSSRLKCWHAHSLGAYGTLEVMGVLFVTLAVLCPNFTFVSEWSYRGEYDSTVGYILSSGLYDEHAERLGHIFEPR